MERNRGQTERRVQIKRREDHEGEGRQKHEKRNNDIEVNKKISNEYGPTNMKTPIQKASPRGNPDYQWRSVIPKPSHNGPPGGRRGLFSWFTATSEFVCCPC